MKFSNKYNSVPLSSPPLSAISVLLWYLYNTVCTVHEKKVGKKKWTGMLKETKSLYLLLSILGENGRYIMFTGTYRSCQFAETYLSLLVLRSKSARGPYAKITRIELLLIGHHYHPGHFANSTSLGTLHTWCQGLSVCEPALDISSSERWSLTRGPPSVGGGEGKGFHEATFNLSCHLQKCRAFQQSSFSIIFDRSGWAAPRVEPNPLPHLRAHSPPSVFSIRTIP